MITSGRDSRTRSITSRRCSMSAASTSPSESPSDLASAPQISAAWVASFQRSAAISSEVWTKLPRSPREAWHITTSCPSRANRASVPPQRISRSSGCAPTARTFISSHQLQRREVEERVLDRLQREPHAAERDRLVAELREDDARRDRDERVDLLLERRAQRPAGAREAAADDHRCRVQHDDRSSDPAREPVEQVVEHLRRDRVA